MNTLNMEDYNCFFEEFFDILRTYQRCPGQFIYINKTEMPQPLTIYNMMMYIDTAFKDALVQNGYQYVPRHSNMNEICLFDLTHGNKEYDNCIDEIEYAYDNDTDEVVQNVVNSKTK